MTVNTDIPPAKIALAIFDKEEQIWSRDYRRRWYSSLDEHVIKLQRTPKDHVEVGAPPIKTDKGWLLIYSYIQNYFSPPATFGIEAVLLDLEDPSKVITRTKEPFMVPEAYYEQYGNVPNVIFPSGAVLHEGNIFIYYGAADTTCCLATAGLKDLLKEVL